jgi:hypothetical protein
LQLPYTAWPPSISKRNVGPWYPPGRKKENVMLDIAYAGLGLGLIGLMAGYLALLRKA